MSENTIRAFFELVKAGMWSNTNLNLDANLNEGVDWGEVYRLAEEQSMIGIVAAGIDNLNANDNLNFRVPQAVALQFIGQTLQIEQRNKAMNVFVADLFDQLRTAGIYAILVKGQGVAQCYEKPLWRSAGDVDLLLSENNYEKAKAFLLSLGEMTEPEEAGEKHLAMKIGQWEVELHGTLHIGLSSRVDRVLDKVQREIFYRGEVRTWMNGNTQIFLPDVNEDVVYVFAHVLQHFYKGGIGVRQICDWCRLLYTYKDSLDYDQIESLIKEMGLVAEWKAFGAFAVGYLGMPIEAMPLPEDNDSPNLKKKAERICEFILEVGNFGHNRDKSYYGKYPYFLQKCISAWQRVKDLARHARIFPVNSLRFFFGIMHNGIISAVRGE